MARFYQTEHVNPHSAYVPLPFEAMAAKLQNMQQAQDTYRQTIDAFDKPFNNLPVDQQTAEQLKQEVQDKLSNLRKMDYNDAANRDQIYKSIKEVRDMYSPQGGIGLTNAKVDQYQAAKDNIQKTYKDNPTQMDYLLKQLDSQFYNQDQKIDYENKGIRKNPTTGIWENTGVNSPDGWTWKDPQKTLENYASQALKEVGAIDSNWAGTPAEAVKMYNEYIHSGVNKEKLDYTMRKMISSDPELQKSASVLSGTDESQFWGEKGWNQNTLLGRMGEGFAAARVTNDINPYHTTVTDQTLIDRKKKEIDDPLSYIGQEVPASMYTDQIDTPEKLGNKISANSSLQQEEWIKMMKDKPQLWAKYGINPDGSNIETIGSIINKQQGGFNNWLKTNGNDFDNSGRLNGLVAEQKKLNIVQTAADNYAAKSTGFDNAYLTKVVKSSDNVAIQKMTPEDFKKYADYQHALDPTTAKSLHSLENKTIGWSQADFDKAFSERDAIAKKYGIDPTSTKDNHDMNAVYNNIENAQSKYDKAKEQFISNNAATISKETYAESVMPVLKADGSVDKDATYDINKQVDKYFTDGTSMQNVVTLVPKDPDHPEAGYYTLADLKMQQEAAQKKNNGSTAKVEISKPWYSTLPDENGNPIMYVNVGSQQVPINANSISVTYEATTPKGKVPVKTNIGQLNNSTETRTNLFLTNLYSTGASTSSVRGFPLDGLPNVKILTASKPENGSWSDNKDLKVVTYDTNGNPIHTLTGTDAFNYLSALEQQKQLR